MWPVAPVTKIFMPGIILLPSWTSGTNSAGKLAGIARSLGIPNARRHIFLCSDPAKPKCCERDRGVAAWDYLKARLKELGLRGAGEVLRNAGELSARLRRRPDRRRLPRGNVVPRLRPAGPRADHHGAPRGRQARGRIRDRRARAARRRGNVSSAGVDPGPGFVDDLFARLLIDDAWALRDERSFSWWPHRVVQRVHAEEPVGEGEGAASRVHVETDVLFADAVTLRQAAVLADLLRFPPLASFVVDREDGVVRLWSAALVTKETAPVALGFLSASAALQAIYAEGGREGLEDELGLPAAASEHPKSGSRPHPDGMLDLLSARIAPEGKHLSRFTDPADWHAAADALASVRGARGSLAARAGRAPAVPRPARGHASARPAALGAPAGAARRAPPGDGDGRLHPPLPARGRRSGDSRRRPEPQHEGARDAVRDRRDGRVDDRVARGELRVRDSRRRPAALLRPLRSERAPLAGAPAGPRGRHGAPRGRGARAPARGHFAG